MDRALLVALAPLLACVYQVETDWQPGEKLSMVEFGPIDGARAIEFDIPQDARGFLLALRADDDESVTIEDLESPGGFLYVENSTRFPTRHTESDTTWKTFQFPYGDALMDLDVSSGTWRATVSGVHGGQLWVRRGYDEGGEVDLVVHAPASVLAQEGYLQQLLEGTFPIAGLELGEVEIVEVEELPDLLGDEAREDLFSSGEGEPGSPKVDVFFIKSVAGTGGLKQGVCSTAGIPMTGTARSAVAIRYTEDELPWPELLRHELGHFFGLSHTTADAILDTPRCPGETYDENRSACPDASNLMFPGVGWELSETQHDLIRRSVAYRAD